MPQLLTQLSTNPAFAGATGMFTFHADFWIQPSVLFGNQGLWSGAADKIWHLGRGLADPHTTADMASNDDLIFTPYPYCFASETDRAADQQANGTRWCWWSPCPFDKLQELAQTLGTIPNQPGTCCVGWAEAWYLPSSTWQDFHAVASHFAIDDPFTLTHHEVMVHTMLEFLSRNLGHPLRVMTECWGSCCNDLKHDTLSYDQVNHFPCGHSIHLVEDEAVVAVTDMLSQSSIG
jgi:hypothetical protein